LELHPAEGTATAVLAGHPPPVLRLNGHVDHLPVRPGPPLGVRNAQYTDTTLLLPRGSTLILYTDGLVEDRQYTLDQGFADLCTAMRTAPTDDPHQLVEHIRHTGVGPRPRRDDVAVLAVTVDVDPPPGPRTPRRHFRGETASTAAARRFTYDILTAWGEQALRGDAGCRIGGRAPRGRS
jgi:stage II sporulation SpoE-like protein